jgi:hypothetical protein
MTLIVSQRGIKEVHTRIKGLSKSEPRLDIVRISPFSSASNAPHAVANFRDFQTSATKYTSFHAGSLTQYNLNINSLIDLSPSIKTK